MMSTRLTSVSCMLMLGLGIATGAGAEPSANLVPNASFEAMTPIPTNVPPGGWEFVSFTDHLARIQPDEAMVVEDPSQAHSGKRFIRLVPSKKQVVLRAPDPGSFDPGLYEVSAWVKGTPGVRGPMGLDVLGANFGAGVWTIGDDEWNKFTMIRYCNGVTNIQWRDFARLGIGANPMEGAHFDIDDVSVTRLTSGLAGTFSDHMVLQRDKPVPVWGWAEHPGQQIKVQFRNQTKMAKSNQNGHWMVVLDPMPAGGPYVLSLDGRPTAFDVMVGDVWVCMGQSNMDFGLNFVNSGYFGQSPDVLAAANHPMMRLWTAPKQVSSTPEAVYRLQQDNNVQCDYQANWNRCTPLTVSWGIWGGFSAVGYYFGREIMEARKLPIGLMMIANGGTQIESYMSPAALARIPKEKWTVPSTDRWEADGIKNAPFPKPPEGVQPSSKAYGEAIMWGIQDGLNAGFDGKAFNYAGALYNGMIAPMAPFAIKGVVWYQGEHNGGDVHYAAKLKAFIEQWREAQRDPKMPFIIVQLCNWRTGEVKEPGFAIARDAQFQVAREDPYAGLAVTLDLADKEGYAESEIHPKNKRDVGYRAALEARSIAYGEKLVSSGPIYKSMKVDGDKIRVTFDSVGGGLVAKGGNALKGFVIAGSDQAFVPAQAEIEGDTLVVHADGVADPKSVRYAFAQCPPEFNLYNKEGLPASPFRTDDWPL